ncbi:MAG: lytic murein transglycosylase [Pseudomonadota bacterium]
MDAKFSRFMNKTLPCTGLALAMVGMLAALADPAHAGNRNCRNTGSFDAFMRDFKRKARAEGVSQRTIRRAIGNVRFAPDVIRRDRRQSFFALSFNKFSRRLISNYRMRAGKRQMKKHARWFRMARERYGVPGPVITAFWALESDFGVGMGKLRILRSLATLAYDCRRPEIFRPELMAALKIIDRGDMTPSTMIGSWAGEIGQTQFLPSHYLNHAIDFNRDGRRDLMRSPADVIGSTANFIQHLGWRRGEPWLQEVSVPRRMPWREADLAIRHPRSQWAKWGVRLRSGRALPRDGAPASLLLPMGRNGPAFLAYENFRIYLKWNQSLIYAITAAHFATRLNGAPAARKARRGANVTDFSLEQIKRLQRRLKRRGYDVGDVDGKLGAKSRAAVKAMQLRLGLPADSYPSRALMNRL